MAATHAQRPAGTRSKRGAGGTADRDRVAELEAELAELRGTQDEDDQGGEQAAETAAEPIERAHVRMTKPKLTKLAVRAGVPPSEAGGMTKPQLVAAVNGARSASPNAAKAADEPSEFGTWDEFWQAHKRKKRAEKGKAATTVIRGVEVVIPHDMPLGFDRRAEELQGSDDEDDVAELIAELFGQDVYDEWVENGMEGEEFQVVLLWGMMRGKGQAMTFEQAVEAVATEGKSLLPAQNRAERRRSGRAGRS